MQILFRFNDRVSLEVSIQSGRIMLCRHVVSDTLGVRPIPSVDPRLESRDDLLLNNFILEFTKSEARSIASALMQAAAEA